jgi:magnesium-transporting ATPase (P-type)
MDILIVVVTIVVVAVPEGLPLAVTLGNKIISIYMFINPIVISPCLCYPTYA